MLVVWGVVEQRHAAVLEVLRDGVPVTEVARRYGVARQTVHRWLRAYAAEGLPGLEDRSSRPLSCPHQMDPVVEARVVELRRANEGWGPISIGHQLGVEGVDPVPGRSSIHRCLVTSRADHPGQAAPEQVGLCAVGTGPADGVVADGHCWWCDPGRRLQGQHRVGVG